MVESWRNVGPPPIGLMNFSLSSQVALVALPPPATAAPPAAAAPLARRNVKPAKEQVEALGEVKGDTVGS